MRFFLALTAVALQAELVCGQGHFGRRRYSPHGQAPPKKVTVYHMFEPKYTGLANKDGGDFKGDTSFLFLTFNPREAANPEADITNNVFEMSTVTVKDWSREYLKCNAPGAHQAAHDICPSTSTEYCCSNRTQMTADTLPGWENNRITGGGYWFSFPKSSEGTKWTEKVERRIKSACLAEVWRSDAGGCPNCGKELDQCVANCIQSALAPERSSGEKDLTKLKSSWDRAFKNKTLCPDQPFPADGELADDNFADDEDADDEVADDEVAGDEFAAGHSGRRRDGRRRRKQHGQAPPKNVTTYHIMEPKYTGLANKDAGDFKGDIAFIFGTFRNLTKGENPEADITNNIFEMSTVTVQDWSTEFLKCNAPGRTGHLGCPSTSKDYCCSTKTKMTADTLPGWESKNGGYWMSFPKKSEGKKWTEKVVRRIQSKCLAEVWRSDAGGCPSCGKELDQCVATCIQSALSPKLSSGDKNFTKLHSSWDRAFKDKTLCPDQPFPGVVHTILV